MLVNPFRDRLYRLLGTRLLVEPTDREPEFDVPMEFVQPDGCRILWPSWKRLSLGLLGRKINEGGRMWTILGFYSPAARTGVRSGIRARLMDEQGFVTFLNQRDLEVAAQRAKPGSWCDWLAARYQAPDDNDWVGFCMDETDAQDDLLEREWEARRQLRGDGWCQEVLPPGVSLDRFLHVEDDRDVVRTDVLLGDQGQDGTVPDLRIETIGSRWARVQQEIVHVPT